MRGSHRMVAEARVVAPGATGVNPAGTTVPVADGDVRFDATANVRATLDMTTEGSFWPSSASDLLAPYGNEIHVRRGVQYGDGSTEWVSLGYYRIYSPEQDDAPNGPIRIAGRDRMSGIVDARLTSPRPYAKTATYGSVVADLVGEVYPWATIEWDDTSSAQTLGRQVVAEDDRYAFLNEQVIGSLGKLWYWDHRGFLVIKTPPSPTLPVWEVGHGEGGVLVAMSRRLSREGVFNAVVATGEGADTAEPVRALVVDSSPNSPTYWYGDFGKVPRFYSSPLLTTTPQARAAAATMLSRQLGLPYSVDFTAVPNPALEPDDPVRVTYPGRSEMHVIERMSVPLTADAPLTATTREQTEILIGEA